MPGLVEGMQGYSATVANLANKDRVRLQAKIDEHQFGRQQTADKKRDELVIALGELDDRERELDANLKLGAIDTAMIGVAEGDWDAFEDYFKVPENRVVIQDSPQLMDEFKGKVNNLRRFNPTDPKDVAARDKFAQSITKGETMTYDELFPGMKEYFDNNSLIIADVEDVGPVAIRSDDLLETLGTTQRRAKARRIFESRNVEIDRLQKKRVSVGKLQQQLQVLDPSYQPAKGQTPLEQEKLGAEIALLRAKAAQLGVPNPDETIATLTNFATTYPKQEDYNAAVARFLPNVDPSLVNSAWESNFQTQKANVQKILDNYAPIASDEKQFMEYASSVTKPDTFTEQELKDTYKRAQDKIKNEEKDRQFKIDKEERLSKPTSTSTQDNLKAADAAAVEFQTKTLAKYKVTVNGVQQPASYDNYALWPQDLKREARSFSANYGQLKGIGATSDTAIADIASMNQITGHAINYTKTASENSRGLWDDFRNYVKSYVDEKDPTRKAAKEAELVGLLMAAASNDRTSVYFTEQMKAIAGTEFGKSYFNQLGSLETILRGFADKLQPYSDFNLNPVDAAIVDSYKKRIDDTVALIQPIIGVETEATSTVNPKEAAEEV